MAEGMLGAFVEVISGSGFLDGAGCPCIVFRFLQGGDSSAKKKKKIVPVTPTPLLTPSLFRGNRLPAPFCLPPLSRFPSRRAVSAFHCILHESGDL